MAITCTERFAGRVRRGGRSASTQVKYLVEGTDDDTVALATMLETAPLTWDGLPRGEPSIEQVAEDTWEGIVQYAQETWGSDMPVAGSHTYRFETSGGSQKIYASRTTRHAYPAGSAPDYGNLIGVTNDSVEGCEIVVPVFRWTETWLFSPLDITPAYMQTLFRLTGRVNSTLWHNYAGGEVLFLGASGGQQGDTPFSLWEITFAFAASPNVTNKVIGGITVAEAHGWDYIWVRYKREVRGTGANASMCQVPQFVYVEQVYIEDDFGALRI